MNNISRRDFLKLSSLTVGGLAFSPFFPQVTAYMDSELVRVATDSVSVYKKPFDTSEIVSTFYKDELLNVYKTITAETPTYNPVWYRVWGGYMHRAHMHKVKIIYNKPVSEIREVGQIGEVTVPYTDSLVHSKTYGWSKANRLYYQTIHWVLSIEEGPDKKPWYRIRDESNSAIYHVPAIHIRILQEDELTPIKPEIPFNEKRIEVELSSQTLRCFEYGQVIFETKISSGLPSYYSGAGIPTITPDGEYNVQVKMPSKHMGDGNLTSDLQAYELVGVPWNCFFTTQGHAFHGTYWHDNFGVPMSHGCINMRMDEAKWLFLWVSPVAVYDREDTINMGTKIIIYK